MTASTITTRVAENTELDAVTDLCLAAFADEAVAAWVVPDPAARQSHLRQMFAASLKAVVVAGALILAIGPGGARVGASIWLPRTAERDARPPEPSTADAGRQARRLAAVEAATEARRPEVTHVHLASMATLPEHRGRGAGAAMIAAGLAEARALDLPVYLEASTSDNRRLYERFGFRDHGEPIRVPDGGPSLQPMWLDV